MPLQGAGSVDKMQGMAGAGFLFLPRSIQVHGNMYYLRCKIFDGSEQVNSMNRPWRRKKPMED